MSGDGLGRMSRRRVREGRGARVGSTLLSGGHGGKPGRLWLERRGLGEVPGAGHRPEPLVALGLGPRGIGWLCASGGARRPWQIAGVMTRRFGQVTGGLLIRFPRQVAGEPDCLSLGQVAQRVMTCRLGQRTGEADRLSLGQVAQGGYDPPPWAGNREAERLPRTGRRGHGGSDSCQVTEKVDDPPPWAGNREAERFPSIPVGGGLVVLIPVRSPKKLMSGHVGLAAGEADDPPPRSDHRKAG